MAELADRPRVESEFARKLSRLSSRHRRELLNLLGFPPNPSNVPDTFWAKVERETEMELATILLLIFGDAGNQHSALLLSPDLRWAADSQVADAAKDWSGQRAREVAKLYTDHSREILRRRAADWNFRGTPFDFSDRARKPTTADDLQDDVLTIFGPSRIERMAVTETTYAATGGTSAARDAAEAFGVKTQMLWRTERDGLVCPVCRPLDGLPISDWADVLPSRGEVFPIVQQGGPPAHVNCRCWLEPKVIREVQEAFCPTGEGGGIDNSCPPANAGGSFRPSAQYEKASKQGAYESDEAYSFRMSWTMKDEINDTAKAIIADYTHNAAGDENAEEMNRILRAGEPLNDRQREYVERFNQLIETYGVETKTFRGISVAAEEFDESMAQFASAAESGKPITIKGFSSTTTAPRQALDFAESGIQGGGEYKPVILEIKTRRGLPVEAISKFPDEQELVLRHASKFKVEKIERDSAIASSPKGRSYHVETLIRLTEIDPLGESLRESKSTKEIVERRGRAARFIGRMEDVEFS